ncbi:MAG: PIN domain-containing protein, partial [Anaerolineae bacterium]|nr:PIN domain-containing protein [Anaerolineae bacterium]
MKILIDTNVLVDVFYNREPFVHDAQKILNLVEVHQVQGFITANAITDLHYVLMRALKDKQVVKEAMRVMLALVEIIDVTSEDIHNAFLLDGVDFEDDLQIVCAERAKM